jgi:FkbM family methyltransferase
MMKIGQIVKKILYKTLSFEGYLSVLSRFYFFLYRTGMLKNDANTQYPYFLKKIIKKGDVVIDLGANLGYYTCLFARWVGSSGKVYAVEPVVPVRNVLKKNAQKYSWVEIMPYALGQENKMIQLGNNTLKIRGYVGSGSHFVMDASHNPHSDENPEIVFQAEMRKGSELFANLTKLNFIKCDVEGYEIVIIPEIQNILEKFHPTLLIETGSENRLEMISIMTQLGYEALILDHQKLRPLTPADFSDILFVHQDNMPLIN